MLLTGGGDGTWDVCVGSGEWSAVYRLGGIQGGEWRRKCWRCNTHTHTHTVISISLHPEKKLISYFRGAAAENETWHRLMIWQLKTKITTGTNSALLRQISNKRQIVCYYEGDWCLPAGFSGSALSEAAQPPTDTHAPRISQHSQRKTSCHREQRCCVPMFPSSTPPQ